MQFDYKVIPFSTVCFLMIQYAAYYTFKKIMNYWGNIFSSQKVTLALKNKSPNHIPERLQFACSLPPDSESGLVYRSELRPQCLQRGPRRSLDW